MLTRALAAEVRHAPRPFLALLGEKGWRGFENVELESVRCEAAAKIDVLLSFSGGRTVGIEAKLDHQLTVEQLDKEKAEVDDLFLLVLDEIDAEGYKHLVSGVVTWREAIGVFAEPRLTLADIEALPPQKVAVERVFRALVPRLEEQLDANWTADVGRGGSGMPSITVRSPELADGRELRGQIQVVGRGMPKSQANLQFEYHVGIETRDLLDDFPVAAEVDSPPGWVPHLMTLRRVIGPDGPERFKIRSNPCGNGQSGVGRNKKKLVDKFLPDCPWIAHGYYDWSLGPKSEPVHEQELQDLAERAIAIFQAWYAAS